MVHEAPEEFDVFLLECVAETLLVLGHPGKTRRRVDVREEIWCEACGYVERHIRSYS